MRIHIAYLNFVSDWGIVVVVYLGRLLGCWRFSKKLARNFVGELLHCWKLGSVNRNSKVVETWMGRIGVIDSHGRKKLGRKWPETSSLVNALNNFAKSFDLWSAWRHHVVAPTGTWLLMFCYMSVPVIVMMLVYTRHSPKTTTSPTNLTVEKSQYEDISFSQMLLLMTGNNFFLEFDTMWEIRDLWEEIDMCRTNALNLNSFTGMLHSIYSYPVWNIYT